MIGDCGKAFRVAVLLVVAAVSCLITARVVDQLRDGLAISAN